MCLPSIEWWPTKTFSRDNKCKYSKHEGKWNAAINRSKKKIHCGNQLNSTPMTTKTNRLLYWMRHHTWHRRTSIFLFAIESFQKRRDKENKTNRFYFLLGCRLIVNARKQKSISSWTHSTGHVCSSVYVKSNRCKRIFMHLTLPGDSWLAFRMVFKFIECT